MFCLKSRTLPIGALLLISLVVFAPESLADCFSLSAYYAPEEGQSYYVTGSLAGDERLNGEGDWTASGVQPYIGSVAAPRNYPFGTRIKLWIDGQEFIFVVEDRGGAIINGSCDRLDLFFGENELALRNAMAFGKATVQGEILPPGDSTPATVDPEWFTNHLRPAAPGAPVDNRPVEEKLSDLGYDTSSVREAVIRFQEDYNVVGRGEYGSGHVGPKTDQALALALQNKDSAPVNQVDPVPQPEVELIVEAEPVFQEPEVKPELEPEVRPELEEQAPDEHWLVEKKQQLQPGLYLGDQGEAVKSLQLALWDMNLYDGEIDGYYGDTTKNAVADFQLANGVVAGLGSPGFGHYGPKTHATLNGEVDKKVQVVSQYPKEAELWMPATVKVPDLNELTLPEEEELSVELNFELQVVEEVSAGSEAVDPLDLYKKLKKGDRGPEVKAFQEFLIERGVLAPGLDTGYYGDLTELAASQLDVV